MTNSNDKSGESLEPGQSVSVVARRNGINANQMFLWRKLYQNGSLSAVSAELPGDNQVKLVSECLGVSRSQLTVRLKQSVSPKARRIRPVNDTELVAEIQQHVSELPSYGYRRVWELLRRAREI